VPGPHDRAERGSPTPDSGLVLRILP
jgi:hypothetical protein